MNRLKVFLKDPNKKNTFKIIKEVIHLTYVKKEIPFYYFKYLYRRNITNYLDYLSLKEQNLLKSHKRLHHPKYADILNNKLKFAVFAESSGIPIPELVCYNLKARFFFKGSLHQVNDLRSLMDFYKFIFDEKKIDTLFFRPISGEGGKGCFKLTVLNFEEKLREYMDLILSSGYINTKVIEQHQLVNQIHDKSINTLRILSLITKEGAIEIVNAFMRFGVGVSVVDNASSGGFFVGINLKEGTLKSKGHFLPEYGGIEIEKHPDSGFKFEGFRIPFYSEARNAVIHATSAIPDRFIGWDVAIGKNGPLIIESNSRAHLQMSNIAQGGMLRNQHIKNVLKELK